MSTRKSESGTSVKFSRWFTADSYNFSIQAQFSDPDLLNLLPCIEDQVRYLLRSEFVLSGSVVAIFYVIFLYFFHSQPFRNGISIDDTHELKQKSPITFNFRIDAQHRGGKMAPFYIIQSFIK